MTDPGDEQQELPELELLRAQLDEAIARRDAIRLHIDGLYVARANISEQIASLRVRIARLGGGFDLRGLEEPRSRPMRQDGRGSWIERDPA